MSSSALQEISLVWKYYLVACGKSGGMPKDAMCGYVRKTAPMRKLRVLAQFVAVNPQSWKQLLSRM